MNRINAADPDALTIVMWLILFCAFMCAVAWVCDRKTRRKNKWIAAPRPDSRSSIEQFRRIHTP